MNLEESSIELDSYDFNGQLSYVSNQGKDFDSIKVLIRIRPLNESEKNISPHNPSEQSTLNILSNHSLSIATYDGRKTYNCIYDTILGPTATQSQVYECIKDCTLSVMQGVNSTIFAYGILHCFAYFAF
jgi:hypothetical protein